MIVRGYLLLSNMGIRLHRAMPNGRAATTSERPRLYVLKKRANCLIGCSFVAAARRFRGLVPVDAFWSDSAFMFLILFDRALSRKTVCRLRRVTRVCRKSSEVRVRAAN